MIRNVIYSSLAALFIVTGILSLPEAKAGDCHYGNFADQSTVLLDAGAKVRPLTDAEVKVLTDKLGPPPGAGQDSFTVVRFDLNDVSMLAVIIDGCIQDKIGPAPKEIINKIFGETEANQ